MPDDHEDRMGSAESPESPFEPAAKSPGKPGSPFAPGYAPREHAAPRLGIAHLLVGTACVALCQGLYLTAWPVFVDVVGLPDDATTFLGAIALLLALGMGPALGGLLLWLARWRRGIPFPRHPGEYLLVVEGILAEFSLVTGFLCPLLIAAFGGGPVPFQFMVGVLYLCPLVGAVAWFTAARRIETRAWRTFLYLCAGGRLLGCCHCGGLSLFIAGHSELDLLISPVLVILAVREHRRGLRYPWTHWLGVGIWLWFALLNVLSFLVPLLWPVRYW